MAEFSITFTVRVAWWVAPYLCALEFFGRLTGLEPDAEKAADLVIRRGMTFHESAITRTED